MVALDRDLDLLALRVLGVDLLHLSRRAIEQEAAETEVAAGDLEMTEELRPRLARMAPERDRRRGGAARVHGGGGAAGPVGARAEYDRVARPRRAEGFPDRPPRGMPGAPVRVRAPRRDVELPSGTCRSAGDLGSGWVGDEDDGEPSTRMATATAVAATPARSASSKPRLRRGRGPPRPRGIDMRPDDRGLADQASAPRRRRCRGRLPVAAGRRRGRRRRRSSRSRRRPRSSRFGGGSWWSSRSGDRR